MKSCNTSIPQFRRTLAAVAVILATGTGVAMAQSQDNGTSAQTNSSTSTDYNNSSNTSSSNNGSMSNMQSSNDNNANTSSSNSKLGWSDRRFIEKAAESNQKEIQVAQLGVERASNPDVKSFAQQMVDDHTKLGQQIQTLAQNDNVQLKTEDKEDHEYKKLASLSGNDFDSRFIKRIVSDHKKDVKEFESRANDAKDPDVKSFAQNTLPALQHHLQMAQSLESSIVPTGRMDHSSGRDLNMTGNTTTTNSAGSSYNSGTSSGATNAGAATSSTGSTP